MADFSNLQVMNIIGIDGFLTINSYLGNRYTEEFCTEVCEKNFSSAGFSFTLRDLSDNLGNLGQERSGCMDIFSYLFTVRSGEASYLLDIDIAMYECIVRTMVTTYNNNRVSAHS